MHVVLLCINHTKCLLHYMFMTLTLKQCDLAFVGKKSIPVSAGKTKKPSKGNVALALVSLVILYFLDNLLVKRIH